MTDDGGPAFPTTFEAWNDGCGGMSLLDYFAAQAMRAALTGDPCDRSTPESVSKYAYTIAAAMLVESKRRKGLKNDAGS